METDRLMQAVLQSFLDADLRVELVPKSEKFQGRTADTGTGPSYDASTQVAARNANNYKHPEPARMKGHSGHMGQRDSTTQAIDGQYATIYRVQHCKMTPTSPPPMTSEFPPQRPDVAYGCDNFQVGGRGSGETGSVPIKTTSYRGGMNWPNRGDVYTPRMSRCSDSDTFERSLRKYPSVSPERSAEVFERLVTYAMPRASRSPRHSPQREPVRPKTYEETYKYRPRAPEEDPTRDRRNDFNHLREASKQAYAKHSDIRQIREMTRRLRKSLKSISSYTHTHTLSTYLDGIDHECDTPILETSETEHEDSQPAQEFSYPVNTTVQAAVPTTSLGVEAKLTPSKRTIAVPLSPTPSLRLTPGHSSPVATTSLGVDTKPLSISRRTIAVPLSPTPSSRCTTGTDNFANPIDNSIPKASLGVETNSLSICKRTIAVPLSPTCSKLTTPAPNLPSLLITKSVQTFHFPGRSVETVTSNTELPKCDPVQIIAKKSKSLNDFRLNRDFKSEILAWLDDTSDPTIKEIQDVVLRNLKFRLNEVPITGAQKIKVKIGDCLKSKKRASIELSSFKLNKMKPMKTIQSHGAMKAKHSDQNEFKDAINEWSNNVSIKKQDDQSKPVEKGKELNTFVDRLHYLAFIKSKRCGEQTMRTEILGILDEVLIGVNACDKAAFLNKLTDALMCKLDNILLGETKTKPSTGNVNDKSNANLHQNQITDKETKNFLVKEMIDDLQTQKVLNSDSIKQTIVDLVDILKDSVNNNIGFEEIANTLHNTTKFATEEGFLHTPQQTEKLRKKLTKRQATNFSTQPLTVFMVQNLSRNYISKTSGTKMSQHSIGSIMDRDIEKNLIRYKKKLAERIDQWLSDLSILKAEDTDLRQVIVLDLASDIVERQKYLEFNKNKTSDIDELEHLKYLIFKWMKRYAGEENMETVHHAVELMEMIRNIPVPMLSKSQDLLKKSISRLCCNKAHPEPGTSTDTSKDSVHNSKSDSGIHNHRESLSSAPSYIVIDGCDSISLSKKKKNYSRKQKAKDPKSPPVNRSSKPNLSRTNVNDNSDFFKYSIENQENSQETLKNELKIKRTCSHILNSFNANKIVNENLLQNSVSQSNSINKKEYSSQDSFVSSKSQDDFHESYSGICCKDRNDEPGASINIRKDGENTSKVNCTTLKKHQNDYILSNYIVHNITNNTNVRSNRIIIREDITSKRNNSKSKKKFNKTQDSSSASKVFVSCDSVNEVQNENDGAKTINPEPGPSGLVTPVPPHAGEASSAVAQLMAEWRPHPVFTPPPPGRPLLDQVHEEFKGYLKNWCEQIPIPANTCEEIELAGKSRLGILNGIWKMITKLKTQPAVFQNKFYYEDVLGKEIDELLDCLPQSQELQEKKYTLKSQLLEKISDMNDLIKEIETPENYKEMVAQKAELMKDQKLRKTVRLDREAPTKIFEEMLKYCTLDDFLTENNYKETNKILEKAYKNKLLITIQAYMDELKKAHGKEMEELYSVYKESDIFEKLNKVPLPTEDDIKENADEILLALEIEQWMKDLPIVKNDDRNEQRQRSRLRDSLTQKIHEMGKRVNISDCCGDTQVRHEISYFLDMVPLEKDQDLNINEMVDELTNRLKNRQGSGGRRKSVAFQNGSRLLNRSEYTFVSPASDIYSPKDKWAFQGNEDTQYKSLFQNPPLCSTKIEQPSEWDLGDDQDAQYRALFKDGVPCSSMIEPQAGYGPGSHLPPDFRHSYDQPANFDFPPRQFNESARRGSFGYSQRGSEKRYQHPDVMGFPMTPCPGSHSPGFYESAAAMPNVPPDSQFQSLHGSCMSGAAHQAPRMTGRFNQSQGVGWMPPEEASGFVSMRDDGPHQMLPPRQRFPNEPPAFSHRFQLDPNISQAERSAAQGFVPMTSYGHRQPQGFMSMPSNQPGEFQASGFHSFPPNEFMQPQPAAFIPNESRFSRRYPKAGSNDPSMRQDLLQDSVESNRGMMPQPLEVSVQVHEAPRPHQQLQVDGAVPFVSMVSQQRPNEPLGARNISVRQPTQNQPSIRVTPARDPTDLDEIQEAQSRSAHLSHIQAQMPVPSRQSSRHAPTNRMTEAASRETSSPQRARLLASNAPSSEISNQPAFYSTPNQRSAPPPHNIRERRQLEKERGPARRLDMDAEEVDKGEERCHCRQRFKEWKGHNCQTCDDCLQGKFYPYPYPYPYMYPPFGRPPFQGPPHCRR